MAKKNKQSFNFKPSQKSIEARNQRKALSRNIRDLHNDRMEQFKIQRELFKNSLSSPFKQMNGELQQLSFQNIKSQALKELMGLKKTLINQAAAQFGKQVLTTIATGGTNLIALGAAKATGLISKSFQTSQIYQTIKQITEVMDKIKLIKNPSQWIEMENQEALKKWDKENKPQSPFAKFKSSWMDTGMYDEYSMTMFIQTKPERGKVYSFSVSGITPRVWEMIANADGAGKMLWDTAWYSKRTKSAGWTSGTGMVRTYSGWLAS